MVFCSCNCRTCSQPEHISDVSFHEVFWGFVLSFEFFQLYHLLSIAEQVAGQGCSVRVTLLFNNLMESCVPALYILGAGGLHEAPASWPVVLQSAS